MFRRFGFVLAATVLIAAPASAQDKKVSINIGGGYTGIYGSGKDHVGNGGNFVFGALFHVSKVVSLQGEYSFTGVGKKNIKLPVSIAPGGSAVPTDFFSDGDMHVFDFNVLAGAPTSGKVAPYFKTGFGVYHRTAKITTPAVGFTTVCDPWWYACYPVAVSVDQVVGSRGSADFGMNFGGGLNFKMGDNSSFYFEILYHYVWGPTLDTSKLPAGVTVKNTKATGQFMPITFGVRF